MIYWLKANRVGFLQPGPTNFKGYTSTLVHSYATPSTWGQHLTGRPGASARRGWIAPPDWQPRFVRPWKTLHSEAVFRRRLSTRCNRLTVRVGVQLSRTPRGSFQIMNHFSCRCYCQPIPFRRVDAFCYRAAFRFSDASVQTGSTPYSHIVPVGVYRSFYVSSRSRLRSSGHGSRRPPPLRDSSIFVRRVDCSGFPRPAVGRYGYDSGRRPACRFLAVSQSPARVGRRCAYRIARPPAVFWGLRAVRLSLSVRYS